MRKTMLAAGLCLLACPATAQDLRGQWEMSNPKKPDFVGVFLIDANKRVTADSPDDGGRPAKYRGYIAHSDAVSVQIALTNGSAVVRTYCSIQSSDFLYCWTYFPGGGHGEAFALKRVGPGPRALARPSS